MNSGYALLKNKKQKLLVTGISLSYIFAFAAIAQDAEKKVGESQADLETVDPRQAVQLDAVTVTARRIEEQAQDVPLPITVVSAATIRNKGFEGVEGIARFTPGFTFKNKGTSDAVTIRGQANIQGEANAAFFIDGVFVQGNINGYDLSNIERVEVIRGPQSALFGRRTFSGAINYISKLPGGEPQGSASLQFGNEGQQQARVAYSAPLSDDLSFRVNAYHNQTDGLFYNSVSGRHDLGGRKTSSIGALIHWAPSTSFSATLSSMYVRNENELEGAYRYLPAESNCAGTDTGQLYAPGIPIYTGRPYVCGELKAPREFAMDTPSFNLAGYPAGDKLTSLRTSLALKYYFENGWELSSISAYNTFDDYRATDQDYSGIRGYWGAFETVDAQPTRDFSQEFRVASDQSLPLHGLVGAYLYQQANGWGYTGDLSGFNLMPGQPGNSLDPITTSVVGPNATIKNLALFGLVEYEFNDHWKASAEVRRARDTVGAVGVDYRTLVINGVTTPLSRSYNNTTTFTSTLPRFTVNYKVSDGLSFYGLAAQGNKPGGFNASSEDARINDASRQSLKDQGFDTYKEETAWTTELGMKSMWLNNRLRINADVFNINWDNQQLASAATVQWVNGVLISNSFTTNIGQSRVRGLEIEGEFQLSREWLISFAYTHLDAKIVSDVNEDYRNYIGTNDSKGNQIPGVPANSAALGATYTGSLANGWGLFGNADISYEGRQYGDQTNVNWIGPATTLNFRVGIEPIRNLRFTAYVNNAFDDDTAEAVLRWTNPEITIAYPNLTTGVGYLVNNPRSPIFVASAPRMFGLQMDYRF